LINIKPKISIITTTYNSAKDIENLLKSIKFQKYKEIEHVVVDCKSTDETIKIIKKYKNFFNIRIIEKKCSIYEGLNIGIKNSSGKILTFIGSDDSYHNPNTIQNIVENFTKDIDYIYGNVKFIDRISDNTTRVYKSGNFSLNKFRFGYMPAHTTMFFRKRIFSKVKKYNLNYKIASDFDFCLKIFLFNYKYIFLNEIITINKENGTSNKNLANVIKSNLEVLQILKKKKIYSNIFFIFYKLINKFIKKFILNKLLYVKK
jgi:glycosyltransferase involved in cell wall biosynthesis